MVLKVFRSVWFVSVLTALAALLYVYAGLPEEVIIQEEAGERILLLSREVLFYVVLAFLALVNVLVYIIAKLFKHDESFRAWFHGLIITLNVFFMVALFLINVYNSNERFDYNRIGFVIYGSVGLVVVWAVAWPFYNLFRKFSAKQIV